MNRRNGHGGGVLLLLHEKLKAVTCDTMNNVEFCDAMWCKINCGEEEKMLIGVLYRSLRNHNKNNSVQIDLFCES